MISTREHRKNLEGEARSNTDLDMFYPARNLARDDARMVKQALKFGNRVKRWLHSPRPNFDIMEVANEQILPMRGDDTSINDEQEQFPRPPVMRVLKEYGQPRNGMVPYISPIPISHRKRLFVHQYATNKASRER